MSMDRQKNQVEETWIPLSLLQKLLKERDLQRLLESLTIFVEEKLPGLNSIIFTYDSDNKVLTPASNSNLPDYVGRPDIRVPVQANAGTSGHAAFLKEPVLTKDIFETPDWAPFRNTPTKVPFRSALSLPILSSKQDLLGAFSFYYSDTLEDWPKEMSFFQTLCSIAAVTMERHSSERKTKALLEQLQSSQERLNLVLATQKMGVFDWYIKTDNLNWDDTAKEIYGISKDHFKGHLSDWSTRLHPDDLDPTMKTLERILAQEEHFIEEFRILRAGEVRYISCMGTLFRDDQGTPLRMTGLHYDVTDRVLAQKKLEQERAKYISNSKMASLGEMASGIAHEVNNPLTIILNRANQMKGRLLNDSLEKEWALTELEKIEITVERIAKIIRGLRAFSRNADSDPMISCEFNSILDETLELCREKFKRNGIHFSFQGLEAPFVIRCRPSQISQVLLNLFNNSFDAIVNTNGPWIELKIATHGDSKITLRVTDSGPGIPPAVADKMMNPFFSTKEVGRGTGLGLSISKGIIEDHSGRLWYDRSHSNTSFVIELPIVERVSGV